MARDWRSALIRDSVCQPTEHWCVNRAEKALDWIVKCIQSVCLSVLFQRPTNSRLYSHCMSCMKTLGTPPTQTPVCKECIGRTIPNTQIPRQGPSHPLRSVAPLSTQTSVNPMQMQGQAHHRPNHEISRRWPTRPVIPHYNAKGELMPFPNLPVSPLILPCTISPNHKSYLDPLQLPCYPPVQIPQLAPASALFQANQTSQRKCWRCGISVPAHVIGMTCDDCMAQASAPYVPSNAPPLLSSNLVVANNLSQKKSYSSLAGALSPIQSQVRLNPNQFNLILTIQCAHFTSRNMIEILHF